MRNRLPRFLKFSQEFTVKKKNLRKSMIVCSLANSIKITEILFTEIKIYTVKHFQKKSTRFLPAIFFLKKSDQYLRASFS